MEDREALTGLVIDVALRLHRDLGPGLLESVYEALLAGRLRKEGLNVVRQYPVNVEFEGVHLDCAFRADLLVDHRLIVEIKSVERLQAVHAKQVLTYLGLARLPVGLLLNFGGETLREGIRRLVNDYRPSATSTPLRENQSNGDR